MSENKQPMSKAKKELIVYIINIITGTILMIAGIIMIVKFKDGKAAVFALSIVMACLGSMVLGMSTYGTYLAAKRLKNENK